MKITLEHAFEISSKFNKYFNEAQRDKSVEIFWMGFGNSEYNSDLHTEVYGSCISEWGTYDSLYVEPLNTDSRKEVKFTPEQADEFQDIICEMEDYMHSTDNLFIEFIEVYETKRGKIKLHFELTNEENTKREAWEYTL
jgi:hypothetical protein